MKKYLIALSGAVLLASVLTIINYVQAEEAGGTTAVSPTSIMGAPPIIKDIAEGELQQSLSIKEIKGRIIRCLAMGICPTASEAQYSTEVLIKAAKVTEVGSDYLKVSIFGYIYKIDISGSKLVRQYWGTSEIDEFSAGDIANVFGYLDSSDNYLVHAQTVRNVSIQRIHNTFKGVIESIDATSASFALATEERGNQTVKVTAETKIVKSVPVVCIQAPCPPQETIGSFADLQVGMRVIVRGLWDKTLSTIQARVITIGGKNAIRPFFQKPLKIEKLEKLEGKIEKFTEKLETKIEKGAGQSPEAMRNKIEEIQKKIAEILKQIGQATTTTATSTTQ